MKSFFKNVLAVIVGNLLTFFVVIGLLLAFAMLSMVGNLFSGKGLKTGSVLELTFENPIKESTMDDEFSLFSFSDDKDPYFRNIIRSINNAKNDNKIEGISLKVNSFSGGLSQLSDVRDALKDFKESGKFVYAYSHNTTQGAYYLNSVADSIFQNPMGMIQLQGLGTEVMFYKNLGDKYGIDFQVIRHGDYKSAVEPFLRDDLSEENREQLMVLFNDFWKNISTDIAQSRNIPIETLNSVTDSLYGFNPDKALQHKLVDKIAHEGEYDQILAARLGVSKKDKESLQEALEKYTVSLGDYSMELKNDLGGDEIAVLYASGGISSGDAYSGIQSEVYKEAIRDLAQKDKVKAVVLRINSPGGSADASEEILYELRELRKKKPIIVSFGDIAASGGYYIATEADAIYASPNTLTGSIGVLGMMPSFKKLVNNLGVTTDYVNTNENSDFLRSPFKPLSETGNKVMVDMIENTYNVFVGHVMRARNMTFEEVDAVGGGRVWSGTQALEIGLVDKLGTLEDAINEAASKADIDSYRIGNYPKKDESLEALLKNYPGISTELGLKQELGEDYYRVYSQLKAINELKGIQLRMPFEIMTN